MRRKNQRDKDVESTPVPKRIGWDVWRIAASERFSSSLIEIESQWTLVDVATAHDILDLYGV